MRNRPLATFTRWFRADAGQSSVRSIRGGERLKVIVLLAGVLGLDVADKATIGAIAVKLEQAFHIGNLQIGLLVTVTAGVDVAAALPLAILADRLQRVRLLAAAILLWSIAMALGGFSTSYVMLLCTRLALGAVVAIAAPAIASLTGDFFAPTERGRIYGFLLAGELVGAAVGFLLSGGIADFFTWRAAFWVLAAIGLALAAALHWGLREPARGRQGRLATNRSGARSPPTGAPRRRGPIGAKAQSGAEHAVRKDLQRLAARPERHRLPAADPARMTWLQALDYISGVRSFLLILVASELGYFYLAGLKTFLVLYMHAQFGLGELAASAILVASSVGALVGVLLIGRGSDRLIARGFPRARIWAAAVAFLVAVAFLLPGFLADSLYATGTLFFIGALGLAGANPPMTAARLDVIHSRLWARAESLRVALHSVFVAIAPLVFGAVSTLLQGADAAPSAAGRPVNTTGLGLTFVFMLTTLAGAGIALLFALKPYPGDVASARAFELHSVTSSAPGQ